MAAPIKLKFEYKFGIQGGRAASRLYREDVYKAQCETHTPRKRDFEWGKQETVYSLDEDKSVVKSGFREYDTAAGLKIGIQAKLRRDDVYRKSVEKRLKEREEPCSDDPERA